MADGGAATSDGAGPTRYPGGAADSPGFLLWRLTLDWQRAITAALAPYGLTHVQFVLLACAWWLGEHGEPPNQLGLARQAGTDVKMTSQVVRKLAAKGLLERAVDPADSRARRLRLTAAGGELARRAVRAVEAVDAEFFGPDEPAATRLLTRMLHRRPDRHG
ncbi:MarR family winged helix-turn-helix transcriptional regulator [Actinocatenispora comari]|uniref:MarR family transcriptional regulator n=1 Tax=Actinocatenispora comari TaxID=2807577 RepID=A0A8J4AHC6_9ACTN|nr:MarR family transcriptional regulator [Actinocatenispora comari]GIL28713.1 MarR family transcriptional regulator [Actinocatenispora comari]